MSTAKFPFIYLTPISIPNILNSFCLFYLSRKKGRSGLISCHSVRMLWEEMIEHLPSEEE